MSAKTIGERLRQGVNALPAPVLRRAFLASLVMTVFFIIQAPLIFQFTPDRDAAALQDYLTFHVVAEHAVTGDVAPLYDPVYFHAQITQEHGLLWLYPPTMLLFLAPFGLIGYGAAKFLWLAGGAASFFFGAYWLTRRNLALAGITALSPAAWAMLKAGQLSSLFALLAVGGLLLSRTRPLMAGVMIGILTIKPQFGLLIPVFLVVTQSWRAFVAASITTLLLIGVSAAVFGLESWSAFFASLTGAHSDFMLLSSGTGRLTIVDSVRNMGWSDAPSLPVYAGVLAMAAYAVFYAARRGVSHRLLAAITLALGVVTTPYIWIYDWVLLIFALLIALDEMEAIDTRLQSAIAVVWFAPIIPYLTEATIVVPLIWGAAALCAALFYEKAVGFRPRGASALV